MATWIIGLVIIGAVYFAAKYVIKATKNGGCVGCDSGSECGGSCPHCRHETQLKLKK